MIDRDIPGQHAGRAIFLCSEYPRADTRGTSERNIPPAVSDPRNPGQGPELLSLPRSLPGPGSESRSPRHIRVTGRGPAPGGCHWSRFPASIIMMMIISGIGPLCPFRWTVDFNVT
jgi:hypothetical protein